MLQAYSSNLDVAANAAYSFNNITIHKGCAERLSGPSSIELNTQGVYMIAVDGFATAGAATLVSVQLYVNGVAQPQAISAFTGISGAVDTFNFETLVQVKNNNCPCNCTASPTVLQVLNGDTNVTNAHINIKVTKLR